MLSCKDTIFRISFKYIEIKNAGASGMWRKPMFRQHSLSTKRCEIIGINHGFQCSNIRWITRKVFEHKAAGRVFKHLPSDPANV